MSKTLNNPDTLEGVLYQPDGNVSIFPYVPSHEDFTYMDMALGEAQTALEEGNVPIGAVFVTTIGKKTLTFPGHSTEITTNNLDAHAEYNAYQDALPTLGRDLSKTAAYVTSEPCDGCTNRFVQGHIAKLVYAADYNDAPGFFRERNMTLDTRLRDAGRTILVVRGLRKPEALKLMDPKNKVH